jgi:polygalacturonase
MLPSVLDIAHDRGLVGIRRALAGAALAAIFTLGQPVLHGEVFKSATYQAKSQTAGIQEAVDAAAKAGGGTVQIPVGTFVLHAVPGRPAIVLRSRVSLIGAGASQTILKLEPNSKTFPAVLANQNFADPDNSEPDHDITLQGFTIDVAVSDQVLRETQLREAVAGGEQEIRLQALDSMGAYPVLRVDPGPNEEIVPVLKVGPGGLRTLLKKPHPAGARVISLVQRLHGLALVGAENVTLDDVTIENAPMDGVYLTSSVTPGARKGKKR